MADGDDDDDDDEDDEDEDDEDEDEDDENADEDEDDDDDDSQLSRKFFLTKELAQLATSFLIDHRDPDSTTLEAVGGPSHRVLSKFKAGARLGEIC